MAEGTLVFQLLFLNFRLQFCTLRYQNWLVHCDVAGGRYTGFAHEKNILPVALKKAKPCARAFRADCGKDYFRCYRSDHNYNSLASFESEASKLEAEVEG